ncbi:unnamed protein product, partial [Laminaria digitata]
EKRNVSLEALRSATKVYPNVITQFEHDGLKDHPLFNSLYVRAFIRSYAKAVGIPAEEVLEAYDEALEGDYKRQLAVEHLDLPLEEVQALRASPKKSSKAEPVFTVDKFEFEKTRNKKSSSSSRQREVTIEDAAASGAAVTFIPKSSGSSNESSIDTFVDGVKTGFQSFFESGKQNPVIQWGLLVGGIGLGLFVILQLLSFQSDPQDDGAPLESNVEASPSQLGNAAVGGLSPDTVAILPAEPIEVKAPIVPVVLGDSIPIYIVASGGKLDPFRFQGDADLRRPYWLNEGDSMLFYVKNRAAVEDHLEVMQIVISGSPYPIYSTDSTARIIITRDSIQTFLESR